MPIGSAVQILLKYGIVAIDWGFLVWHSLITCDHNIVKKDKHHASLQMKAVYWIKRDVYLTINL
ncbi:MAG: hypothetical protein EA359_03705 [Balneolaceae bacterium]|nr:MAG: hypothetical protein EA359_03705 [Balneolaceae bacterium]